MKPIKRLYARQAQSLVNQKRNLPGNAPRPMITAFRSMKGTAMENGLLPTGLYRSMAKDPLNMANDAEGLYNKYRKELLACFARETRNGLQKGRRKVLELALARASGILPNQQNFNRFFQNKLTGKKPIEQIRVLNAIAQNAKETADAIEIQFKRFRKLGCTFRVADAGAAMALRHLGTNESRLLKYAREIESTAKKMAEETALEPEIILGEIAQHLKKHGTIPFDRFLPRIKKGFARALSKKSGLQIEELLQENPHTQKARGEFGKTLLAIDESSGKSGAGIINLKKFSQKLESARSWIHTISIQFEQCSQFNNHNAEQEFITAFEHSVATPAKDNLDARIRMAKELIISLAQKRGLPNLALNIFT